VIIDTSAWIDFSRHAKGVTGDAVLRVVRAQEAMTTDVIRLELLLGLSKDAERTTRALLASCVFVGQEAHFDVDAAVELYQRCRRAGETVRSPNDCLIAAIAIREDVPVLHCDRDFDLIAKHTELKALRR
jgi:predicted nucleic acid-binding protein